MPSNNYAVLKRAFLTALLANWSGRPRKDYD